MAAPTRKYQADFNAMEGQVIYVVAGGRGLQGLTYKAHASAVGNTDP